MEALRYLKGVFARAYEYVLSWCPKPKRDPDIMLHEIFRFVKTKENHWSK